MVTWRLTWWCRTGTAGPGRQKSKEKTWWCRKQELSQRFDGEYYKYYKYYPAKKA